MMLTAKGRYAVMAMVDIAQNSVDAKPVSLADISNRQDITVPYLEQIFARLRADGLVSSVRGPGGGYRLAREQAEISMADIVIAADETIKMTRCGHTAKDGKGCSANGAKCLTHDLWDGLTNSITSYLASVSLDDVCERRVNPNPIFVTEELQQVAN